MTLTTKITASVAALALAGGLAACSDDSDSGSSTASSTSTVKETATETSTASESASSSAAASGTADRTNKTVEVKTADGATTLVPQGVKDAMDKYGKDWGEPASVEETPNGWIVEYDSEHYVTWNENTGGAPTWGEISNNWLTNVRADSSLGFPTAPEEKRADGNGWTQQFEHGSIDWTHGEDGVFGATVTPK